MSKPILKNCPHCGGEISFRVFADKRRKHTKYVLSVKCEDCKTVTTICTKERGGAAFAALAEKWNARKTGEPETVDRDGIALKACTKCGRFPLGFYTVITSNGIESSVTCDCGAMSEKCRVKTYGGVSRVFVNVMQRSAAALWNTKGAIL